MATDRTARATADAETDRAARQSDRVDALQDKASRKDAKAVVGGRGAPAGPHRWRVVIRTMRYSSIARNRQAVRSTVPKLHGRLIFRRYARAGRSESRASRHVSALVHCPALDGKIELPAGRTAIAGVVTDTTQTWGSLWSSIW